MKEKKIVRCGRCGKRLRKGGDNYRLDCTVATDFDGYLSVSSNRTKIEGLVEEIEQSGLTEKELEEQVYFRHKMILCFDCRCTIINFLKGPGS